MPKCKISQGIYLVLDRNRESESQGTRKLIAWLCAEMRQCAKLTDNGAEMSIAKSVSFRQAQLRRPYRRAPITAQECHAYFSMAWSNTLERRGQISLSISYTPASAASSVTRFLEIVGQLPALQILELLNLIVFYLRVLGNFLSLITRPRLV